MNLLEQQAELIDKLLEYTEQQERLIKEIKRDLEDYEKSLTGFIGGKNE